MPELGQSTNEAAVARVAKADERRRLVDVMVASLKDAKLPELKAIICSFYQQLGGADAFAKALLDEFNNAETGSMIRARIIETILGATKTLTAKEESRDVENLTDEDIDRELQSLMAKLPNVGQYAVGPLPAGATP